MTYSATQTATYTTTDIEAVVRRITADLLMIASSSEAVTEAAAEAPAPAQPAALAPEAAAAALAPAATPAAEAMATSAAAPAATPVTATAPGAPAQAPRFALPLQELQQIATQAGLQWVNSDPAKVAAVQAAIAAEPAPIRVPRARPAAVLPDEGPLVLVETRRDLAALRLPFEEPRA